MARLREVGDILNGFAFKSENYVSSGVRIIRIANVQKGFIEDSAPVYYPADDVNAQKYKLEEGDILVSLTGNVGRVGILSKEFLPAALNQRVACLRIKDGVELDRRYLFNVLNSDTFERKCIEAAKGLAQKNLSSEWLKDYELCLPPYNDQIKIAQTLDKVSSLISMRKEQMMKLDELAQSRFVEMFENIKDEDSLKNLCTFIDYRGKTPEKTENGLPFITAKNIKMHHMSFDTQEFISKETYDKVMTRGFPKVGDVVFTTEAPLGNVCRIPFIGTEFYIGQRIITMQTECLEPAYLEYALSSDEFKKKIEEKSSGSTVTGIRSKLLEKLTIPVPPVELQKQFSTFVAQTDKSKFAIQQSLEKLEILKKSLLQKYF